jgi:hypothetical protein
MRLGVSTRDLLSSRFTPFGQLPASQLFQPGLLKGEGVGQKGPMTILLEAHSIVGVAVLNSFQLRAQFHPFLFEFELD